MSRRDHTAFIETDTRLSVMDSRLNDPAAMRTVPGETWQASDGCDMALMKADMLLMRNDMVLTADDEALMMSYMIVKGIDMARISFDMSLMSIDRRKMRCYWHPLPDIRVPGMIYRDILSGCKVRKQDDIPQIGCNRFPNWSDNPVKRV